MCKFLIENGKLKKGNSVSHNLKSEMSSRLQVQNVKSEKNANVRMSVCLLKNAFYKGNPGKRVSVLPIFHFPLKNLHIALIHDRDPLFNKRFDSVFESIGVQIKRLPPSTPQMNAPHGEFHSGDQDRECLNKIIFTSERQLRWRSRNILNTGTIIVPMPGLAAKWSNRIRRI